MVRLILIDGPMGSGKTTVSKMLQKNIKSKTALISLDRLKAIVSDYKLDSKEHLNLASNSGAAIANVYLKDGIDTIVEKAFTREEFIKQFLRNIKIKCKKFIYQLEAPLEIRITRVKKRPLPLGVKKRSPKSKVVRNDSHYKEFKYTKAIVFDSSKLTPRQIVNRIVNDIGGKVK